VNVDQNAAYPAALEALKAERSLPSRVRLRQCKFLNNIVEQDHRTVKKRIWLAKGYGSFQSAWRTLQGVETMHMINKGRVRWLPKGERHWPSLLCCQLVQHRRLSATALNKFATCWPHLCRLKSSQRNRFVRPIGRNLCS
jgi:hypothetical protein